MKALSWKNKSNQQILFKGDKQHGFFFVCHKCDHKFASTKALMNHTCGEHLVEDENPSDEVEGEDSIEFIDTQSKENVDECVIKIENSVGQKDLFFNCKSCGKYLRSSASFEEHMEKHRKDIPIPCQDVVSGCGETFFTGSDMIKHMLKVHGVVSHPKQIRLKCPKCKYTGTKELVKRHLIRHNATKNFTCTECGKAFKDKIGMENHINNHKGIYDFPCDKCENKYVSKSALRGHVLQKHDIQTFICNQCGAVFKLKMLYTNHMRGHTGEKTHKCRVDDCEIYFRHYLTRNNHERTHKGVKEFNCEQCGKTLMRRYSLVLHMRIHQGKLEYKCTGCGKGFVDSKGANKCKHSGRSSGKTLNISDNLEENISVV